MQPVWEYFSEKKYGSFSNKFEFRPFKQDVKRIVYDQTGFLYCKQGENRTVSTSASKTT